MNKKLETILFEYFEEIGKNSKHSIKIIILKNIFSDKRLNNILQKLLPIIYGKRFVLGVNEKSLEKIKIGNKYKTTIEDFFELVDTLQKISSRNKILEILQHFFENVDQFHAKWYKRILLKDLRIGLNRGLLSNVIEIETFDKTIPEPMLAVSIDKYSEKDIQKFFNNDITIELKIDGYRCLLFILENDFLLYSRRGKRIENLERFIKEDIIKIIEDKSIKKPLMLDGEIFSKNWNKTMAFSPNRIKNITKEEIKDLKLYIFDYLENIDPMELKRKYIYGENLRERKSKLDKLFEKFNFKYLSKIKSLESSSLNSLDSLIKFTKVNELFDSLEKKYPSLEGIMIKNLDSKYYFSKRSKEWMKMKYVETVDLEVIDVEISKKRPDEIANLICKYNEEVIKVPGIKENLKKKWAENPELIIGKIIEIRFYSKTKNGKLRNPIFMRIRADKRKP